MLNYLLAHPELSFSPLETADLCEAFDMAVAELQEKEGNAVNWTVDDARGVLAAVIVENWQRGERDLGRLCDHALETAGRIRAESDRR